MFSPEDFVSSIDQFVNIIKLTAEAGITCFICRKCFIVIGRKFNNQENEEIKCNGCDQPMEKIE